MPKIIGDNMKKFVSILLCAVLIFSLSACAKSSAQNGKADISESQNTSASSGNKTDENADGLIPGVNTNEVTSDTLICYFSCTGNTAQIASYISLTTGGDLFEIIPKQPYSKDDLDYNNKNSRTNAEHKNSKSRPDILSKVSSWDSYKTVYIGYPIWYGDAPKIVYTFLETYDCSGKTVIPFCTSSSSSIEQSVKSLKSLSPGAEWKNGIRFDPASTEQDVAQILKNK